ncbi:unnamed protein product [Staurois parvus]|uniref:Uncharacterized protein n=1 Tax=Staurois parvus TaxID=386267 RepID=A0ABN9FHJ1_9NEOB|nr:unnamed protein product [Staurois parvus]
MTRDCGHSTGDDQRLQTFVERGRGRYLNLVPAPTSVELSSPPPCSLVGHVTGPTRLREHSQSSALLDHVQWAPGCEAASCHSLVPTMKMLMPGREDGRWKQDTTGPRNR